MTKVPQVDGRNHPDAVAFHHAIQDMRLPVVGGRAWPVMAVGDSFAGWPAHGLRELVEQTRLAAPAGVEAAFVAAQRVDAEAKAKEAGKAVAAAAAQAAAAAATPIPFADAALLVPIQLRMMSRIALLHNVPVDRATLLALGSVAATTGAGRSIASGLVKMIPGAGTIAGGVIGAGVASSVTAAMGAAWITVCKRYGSDSVIGTVAFDPGVLQKAFTEEMGKTLKGSRAAAAEPAGGGPGAAERRQPAVAATGHRDGLLRAAGCAATPRVSWWPGRRRSPRRWARASRASRAASRARAPRPADVSPRGGPGTPRGTASGSPSGARNRWTWSPPPASTRVSRRAAPACHSATASSRSRATAPRARAAAAGPRRRSAAASTAERSSATEPSRAARVRLVVAAGAGRPTARHRPRRARRSTRRRRPGRARRPAAAVLPGGATAARPASTSPSSGCAVRPASASSSASAVDSCA